jgi:hypothetical protein
VTLRFKTESAARRSLAAGRPAVRRMALASNPCDDLAWLIEKHALPVPVREFQFAPARRFRADFAWPSRMILCEVEGGVWTGGRHVSGDGYTRDAVKYNTGGLLGYRVFRVTPEHIESGYAIELLREVLSQ